jgi:hypothetical protein
MAVRGSGAGVIPSGTSEPWKWAENEARTNNALYDMFLRQKFDAEQKELARVDARNNQGIQNEFTLGRDALSRDFTRERDATNQDFILRRDAAKYEPAGGDRFAQFRPVWREIEKEKRLPEYALDIFQTVETGDGSNQQASASSAGGPFQFIDETAERYGIKNRADRFDPVKSAVATAQYMDDNRKIFMRQIGREPTGRELYLMHQQGEGGGPKLLRNPNARAVDVVGLAAVVNNRGSVNMSAAQFANHVMSKYDRAEALWRSRRASQQTPTAPTTTAPATTPQPVQQPTGQPQSATVQQAPTIQSKALGQRRFVPDPNNPGKAILVGG